MALMLIIAFSLIGTILSLDINTLRGIQFDEITIDEAGNSIGWVKIISCDDPADQTFGTSDLKTEYTFGIDEDRIAELLPYAISFKIDPSPNGESDDEDFEIQTVACSNPVVAMNNGLELSYVIDTNSLSRTGFADLDNWYGNAIAKSRLWNSCAPADNTMREFPGVIYHACNNADIGLHIFGNDVAAMCRFDWNEYTGKGMDMYLGFDRSKHRVCDGNGNGGFIELQCTPATSHCSAYLSGDPHFRTFNGVHEHFQGSVDRNGIQSDGRGYDVQYYLMTPCDADHDRSQMPFDFIGSFAQYGHGPMSLENYIVMVLYDDDETYYAFLSGGYANLAGVPPLRRVLRVSDGASTYHRDNTQNSISIHKVIQINGETEIGSFKLYTSGNDQGVHVTLTMSDGCTLQFYNSLQGQGGTYRWHWLEVQPPSCYLCTSCGLFGDFQTPYGESSLLSCNGERISYYAPWVPATDNYAPDGWTYEKEYHDNNCGSDPDVIDQVPEFDCPDDVQQEVYLACQIARDELQVCCRNLGGAICTLLQEDCNGDVCLMNVQGMGTIDDLVQTQFTDTITSHCTNQGAFGPVPKLLYDFQDDSLSETISGDVQYDLTVPAGDANNAEVINGVLHCDGDGDFVYSEQNLDFEIQAHSFEVMVAIDTLASVGGGTIGIDSNYDVSGNYAHNQFDSIVFNELSNNRKWFLGSEYFRRTDTSGGITVETLTKTYIHLVAVYDKTAGNAILYRNGVEEQNYIPANGFMTAAANSGVRMMFCQRHLNAGGTDFHGQIRYGAYYDYALGADEVGQLFDTAIATVTTASYGQFEVIGDELKPDIWLTSGQALRSPNGNYVAAMQEDGNFVVYDISAGADNYIVMFATATHTTIETEYRLILQGSDGNLVIYGYDDSSPKWASYRTYSSGDDEQALFLIMQDDGNLVAYKKGSDDILVPYWDSMGYSVAAKTGLFNKDSGLWYYNEDGSISTSSSSMTWLIYLIGLLLITNIVCLTIYCLRKKNNKTTRYKMVSIESTDIDSDAEEINLK